MRADVRLRHCAWPKDFLVAILTASCHGVKQRSSDFSPKPAGPGSQQSRFLPQAYGCASYLDRSDHRVRHRILPADAAVPATECSSPRTARRKPKISKISAPPKVQAESNFCLMAP